MASTSIEWTDHSLNPIRARGANGKSGHYCVKVSPGCAHCYSSRFQPRLGLPQFQEQRGDKMPELFLDAKTLAEPLRRRKPTKYFWCDMTDMFGEWVPFEWIAACFGVMAATPRHTHQILTKRSGRMRQFFRWLHTDRGHEFAEPGKLHVALCDAMQSLGDWDPDDRHCEEALDNAAEWPLKNVWLGCSVENQEQADKRVPDLLACPAAVRFVSAEPLLGPIDLSIYLYRGVIEARPGDADYDALNWVICGSESGHGARTMRIEWAESLRDQCAAAGVAYFQKQIANEHDRKGGKPEFWPGGPWPREFPTVRP